MTIADRPARLTDEQIAALTEPELVALRRLLDRLIPAAAAIERAGEGADISLTIERGTAAAFITLSTEV